MNDNGVLHFRITMNDSRFIVLCSIKWQVMEKLKMFFLFPVKCESLDINENIG